MTAQALVQKNATDQVNRVQIESKAAAASDSVAKNEQMTQGTAEVTLTDDQVTKAIKWDNDNVPSKEIPGICKIVGVSQKSSFDEELVRAIANWQASNNLEADGKYGNTSRTFGARQDYQEYINNTGLDNIISLLNDALQREFSAGMSKIDAKYDVIDRIARAADVPPEMVGAIWYREGSVADGVYLHNGQPLGRPTDLVPAGIMFEKDQFEEAAIHALNMKSDMIHSLGLNYGSLDFAAMCAYTEGYNGWGYRMYHPQIASAYVNSGTTNYTAGKYTGDGTFSETFVDGQVGTLPIMLETLKRHPRSGGGGGGAAQATQTNNTTQNSTTVSTGTTNTSKPAEESQPHMAQTADIDVERAVRVNRSYNYGREVWIEIQTAIGLTGDDVDGKVGPITAQKIADWQAAHGFTGKDLDGICGSTTLAAIRSEASVQTPSSTTVPESDAQTGAQASTSEPVSEPAPAKPEVAEGDGAGSAQPASGVLSADAATNAASWNNNCNYTNETISQIKSVISGSSGNSFDAADAQKIASWQQNQGLTGKDVDGKFGTTSCGLAGITPTYNVSDTHTLGRDTPSWCTQHGFVNGTTLDTLKDDFKTSAEAVIGGITAAGGSVTITSTLRHPARAAVMYYAKYLNKTDQVKAIFNQHGISVDNKNGANYDAQCAFGIQNNTVGLNSNHIYGHAVDMNITSLPSSINVNGTTVNTGGNKSDWIANASALDSALKKAGVASNFKWYGSGDEVHWSTTGR